jgi:hypothetical protein
LEGASPSTSTKVADDIEDRARIVACVKRGVEALGEEDKSTLYFLEERSGMTLEKLVDTPDELVLALREVLGRGSVLILDSIRRELILSSVGRRPLNGRMDGLLLALDKAKAFTFL